MLTLPTATINGKYQTIHLLMSRSTPRSPMTADIFFSCLEHLKITLLEHNASEVHFSINDPERPLRNLYDFYTCLTDLFADTALSVVLHDRTYVSIANVFTYPDSLI